VLLRDELAQLYTNALACVCASQGRFLRTTQRDSGVPVVTVVVIEEEEEDADAEVESIKVRYQSRYGQSTATAA
jgi:F420-0:gamma-glutamyl ligase